MFQKIVDYFVRSSRSRALSAELGAMSDRQLADIGLNRGDIDFIVQQSYGAEDLQQISTDAYGRNLTRVPNLVAAYAGSRLA